MRIAAQLYTLREHTQTGPAFKEALRRCAEIGFDGIQLSAVRAMDGDEPKVDAELARTWLDELGLACCATHRSWSKFVGPLEEEIEFHQTLGCDYAAVPGIGSEFGVKPESYRSFLEQARPVAERLAKAAIRFGFHNHAHEFIRDAETGEPCIHLLTDPLNDWLQMEVDTYWVAEAGVCPADFLARCGKRISQIHVKDCEVVEGDGPVMAPVGEGNLNWDAILRVCRESGTEWLIVEQDTCRRDPYSCLKSSLNFLREKISN